MPQMFQDFLTNSNAMIPLDHQGPHDTAEMVFVHSHDSLIEKELGPNESIIVCSDLIAAFSSDVQIEGHTWGNKFVKVTGAGIVYIETNKIEGTSLASSLLKPQDLTR